MTETETTLLRADGIRGLRFGRLTPQELGFRRDRMIAVLRLGRIAAEVREAMSKAPRHIFVPKPAIGAAYFDRPISYSEDGMDSPVSQPTIIAEMVQWLAPRGKRVLEVGTGTGYQAAVLSLLARKVYSIDISERAIALARRNLSLVGARNVRIKAGDGMLGWQEAAPFDGIIVAATVPPDLPSHLFAQLKVGGRLVMPVGGDYRPFLELVKATDSDINEDELKGMEERLRSTCRLVVIEKDPRGRALMIHEGTPDWSFVPIKGKGQKDWWWDLYFRKYPLKKEEAKHD